jgi:4-hydroxybenzoate polyprenyltransferase
LGIRSYLQHLRLGFNVILVPIFLWGFYLSGGQITWRFWLGLFVFHILFYGGSVAFNSFYDFDEGPIGGLWAPPKPTYGLLVFALAIQAAGVLLVVWINWWMLAVVAFMGVLSTAYSHPAVRLKRWPWASILAVSFGQGFGGAAAGWFCGQSDPATLLALRPWLGFLVATLVTTGYYPLTQIYQREEDRRRGDNTFAVRYGERSFFFAILCLVAAAFLGTWLLWTTVGLWAALVLGVGLLGMAALIYRWWRRYDDGAIRYNFVQVHRLGYVLAGGFVAYIVWQLAVR